LNSWIGFGSSQIVTNCSIRSRILNIHVALLTAACTLAIVFFCEISISNFDLPTSGAENWLDGFQNYGWFISVFKKMWTKI